ncbi:MAG: SPFH domain-containing protein [archaeon]
MKEEQKQSALFITLVFALVFGAALLTVFNLWYSFATIVFIIAILALVYISAPNYFVRLNEYERAVIFHRGKFERVAGPGWTFLIPFIESHVLVDLRTKSVDIPAQEVVTKDNVKLKIDAILFLKVQDPKKAVLNVENYQKSAVLDVQAALRSVVGQMEASDVISSISKINAMLKESTKKVTEDWGVEIENVEIQSVTLPEGLQKAMHALKEAQQKKLAAKETAEGMKIKLDAVQEAASKFSQPTLQYMYLQSLQKIAEGKSSKIIFPMELSRLAASVSEKFGTDYAKAQQEIAEKYKEKAAAGEKKKSIIDELKEEYGIEKLELTEDEKALIKAALSAKLGKKKK